MAARKTKIHPDHIRAKIQASQLVNRLESFVNGKIELSPAQVTAALGLLRKVVSDLSSTELKNAPGETFNIRQEDSAALAHYTQKLLSSQAKGE